MVNLFKSKQGKPTLTFIIIALGAFVAAMILISNFYSGLNQTQAASDYAGNYSFTNDQTVLTEFNSNLTNKGMLSTLVSGGSAIFSVLNIGLSALRVLVGLPDMIITMINKIGNQLPGLAMFIWFAIFAIGVYVVMMFIKALRGTVSES